MSSNPPPLVASYPESYQPIVGLIFWHLSRGQNLAEATAAARESRSMRGIPQDVIYQAANIANQLFIATQAVQLQAQQDPSVAAGVGLFPLIGPYAIIGVRVEILWRLPGNQVVGASVLVNVPANTSVEAILAYAMDRSAQQQWGTRYAADAVGSPEASIAQISGIPWDSVGVITL